MTTGYGMTREQREAEIARILHDEAAVLATPLASEGAISPAQMGMMSKGAFVRWQSNGQRKMILQAHIRDLRRSDDEINAEHERMTQEAKDGARRALESRIKWWKDVGRGKNGKLRPKIARAITEAEAELAALT